MIILRDIFSPKRISFISKDGLSLDAAVENMIDFTVSENNFSIGRHGSNFRIVVKSAGVNLIHLPGVLRRPGQGGYNKEVIISCV